MNEGISNPVSVIKSGEQQEGVVVNNYAWPELQISPQETPAVAHSQSYYSNYYRELYNKKWSELQVEYFKKTKELEDYYKSRLKQGNTSAITDAGDSQTSLTESMKSTIIEERDRQIAERDRQIAEQRNEIAEQKRTIDELWRKIDGTQASGEREIGRLEAELRARDESMGRLERQLDECRTTITRLESRRDEPRNERNDEPAQSIAQSTARGMDRDLPRSESQEDQLAGSFRKAVNDLMGERDISKWKDSLVSQRFDVIAITTPNGDSWVESSSFLGDSLCALYTSGKAYVIPSPADRSLRNAHLTNWYDMSGSGSKYRLESLAVGTINPGGGVQPGSKGRISFHD